MRTAIILREENIVHQIHFIRGYKVMLDFDLASLYNVETKALKRAVRRNMDLFPADFMFELREKEWEFLRSQFGTSSWGGLRYQPMVFTEQGVAMLSGVLKSKRARKVNIAIMRAFVQMRKLIDAHKGLEKELRKLENRLDKHDQTIQVILDAIRSLLKVPNPPRKRIGFKNYDQ